MDDEDGVLRFDFEGDLDAGPTNLAANSSPPATMVCRYWLRGLCMNGEACTYLHHYDSSQMAICRAKSHDRDCELKHTNEHIKECDIYNCDFCPNGPNCRYRHVKVSGPTPTVEEITQKFQNFGSSNKFFTQGGDGLSQENEKSQFYQAVAFAFQELMRKPSAESSNVQQSAQQTSPAPVLIVSKTPTYLPQGISRYFIVKSCNRENLELSVQHGVWATNRCNEDKLNEAFDSADNVILIFSVNGSQHFQGCAKMMSRVGGSVREGNWKYAHGFVREGNIFRGQSFSLKWLKLCELSFNKTLHLRNPYNENLPVKVSRDCQELEPSVGEKLASLLYIEPDSELMAVSIAAESKREEEKTKGVNPYIGNQNLDIVPFEDDEESEEERFAIVPYMPLGRGRGRGFMGPPQMPMARGRGRGFMGPPQIPMGRGRGRGRGRGFMGPPQMPMGRGRGRGRGFMLPPQMPMGRGARPFHGMTSPRGFGPSGSRFFCDFIGPPPAMMSRGRPYQPRGMMMDRGRGPFMGGMRANPARDFRPPVGVSHSFLTPAGSHHYMYRNDGFIIGLRTTFRNDGMRTTFRIEGRRTTFRIEGVRATYRNEERESENVAPRRSMHGEREE